MTAKKSLVICALLFLLPSIVDAQALIQTGITTTSNTSLTVASGTAFALPQGRGTIITWQTSFTANPTSITVVLRFSLDNVSYFTVDTSTSNSGELRYLGPISAKFIRCDVTAVVVGAGSGFQCKINVLGFNNTTAVSGGVLTTGLGLKTGCGPSSTQGLYFSGDTDTGFCWSAQDIWRFYSGNNNSIALQDGIGLRNGSAIWWTTSGTDANSPADARFRRTAVKTVTFDDGAAGNATFSVTGNITGTTTVVGNDVGVAAGGDFYWTGRSIIDSANSGKFTFKNGGESAGVTLDTTTDGRLTLRDRADAQYGSMRAATYILSNLSRFSDSVNGNMVLSTDDGTSGLLTEQFTNNPTCGTNCGTSPTLSGVDSSFTLTMGATGVPASGFVITFNGTWAAAPQCVGNMAKAGMVVGKMPLTLVTTTTTLTVVTNGTNPATTDMYHFICRLGQ